MSFRARLRLFFLLIVVVPMVAVAIVLFRLIADNETGKTDASVAARQRTAINLYRAETSRADRALQAVGSDRELAAALRAGRVAAARARVAELVEQRSIDRAVVAGDDGATIDVGTKTAVAPAARRLIGADPGRFGRLELSVTRADEYAELVQRTADVEVVVREGRRTLASTLPAGQRLPTVPVPGEPVDVDIGSADYRGVSFDAAGFLGRRLRIVLLNGDETRSGAISQARLLAAGILLGFLVLALTFAVAVSRSLQAQIGSFLAAARRLAGGDFSTDVPTTGGDEFAELGQEFNKMSRQLEARLEDLRQERARLETSVRRTGDLFASNLDRDAILDVMVRTAVDAVRAAGGRAGTPSQDGGPPDVRAHVGDRVAIEPALADAERRALAARDGVEAQDDGVYAAAQPILGSEDRRPLAVLAVARTERPFSDRERALLAYLARAVAASLENVGLHETVQRQAVTDELTGLFNHRRFQEALAAETERAKRFGQEVALLMLDIDNFKRVNDTYGHQIGDRVLAEVAHVLRDSCREIDAPARYGGEELAVVLPQTSLDGAFNLAERVRAAIERLELPVPVGDGPLRVTASLGVAAMPGSADEPRELLTAADAALYEAKRTGKNKTVRAGARV